MRFRRLAALVALPALALALAATALPAGASDTNAAGFVSKTNAERTSRGLRAYVVASDLADVARRHSADMAARGAMYHNPNLGSQVTNWRALGENVGEGGTVDSIHQAFMNSPEHRENILATDYTEIGVGTVTDAHGTIWVTEIFRLPMSTPTVSKPVATRATRSVTRTPTAPKPAAPVVKAVRKVVPAAPVRPDTGAILAALLPASYAAPGDPIALMLTYADTLAALNV